MNAYELADWLDRRRDAYEPNGWSADMLRQQANRIMELEGELSRYELRDLEHTSQITELEKQLKEAESILDTIDCGESLK